MKDLYREFNVQLTSRLVFQEAQPEPPKVDLGEKPEADLSEHTEQLPDHLKDAIAETTGAEGAEKVAEAEQKAGDEMVASAAQQTPEIPQAEIPAVDGTAGPRGAETPEPVDIPEPEMPSTEVADVSVGEKPAEVAMGEPGANPEEAVASAEPKEEKKPGFLARLFGRGK